MPAGPLVLLDGDTVGRRRTGDESYTVNLLRELPAAAPELSFACSLRDPGRPARGRAAPPCGACALDVASPYRRIPLAFPALARREAAALAHLHYFARSAPALPGGRDGARHLLRPRARAVLAARSRALPLRARVAAPRRARDRRLGVHARATCSISTGSTRTRSSPSRTASARASGRVADAAERVRERFGIDRPYVLCVGALQRAQERAARDRGLRAADRAAEPSASSSWRAATAAAASTCSTRSCARG